MTDTDRAGGNVTSYVYDGFGDTIKPEQPGHPARRFICYDDNTNVTGKNETGINFSSATSDALDRS